jgi:hypothetical protein
MLERKRSFLIFGNTGNSLISMITLRTKKKEEEKKIEEDEEKKKKNDHHQRQNVIPLH